MLTPLGMVAPGKIIELNPIIEYSLIIILFFFTKNLSLLKGPKKEPPV